MTFRCDRFRIPPQMKNSLAFKILRNFSWMIIGQIAGRVFGFAAVIVLARRLGNEGYGKWAFAFALLSYGMLLADFGLSTYGTIEVAKDREKLRELLGNILSIKITISAVIIVIMMLLSAVIPKFKILQGLIFLTFLNLIPFALSVEWAFRALEDMKYAALWNLIFNFLFFLLIISTVSHPSDILKVPSSRFLALSVASITILLILFRKYRDIVDFRVEVSKWIPIIKVSAVLTASFVMIKIYYNIDTIMLGFFKTMGDVGTYGAIYNFILAISIVRFSLLYAVQPTLSRMESIPREEFSKYLKNIELVSILIGITIYIGVFLLSSPIIKLFYGPKYHSPETVKLLRILLNANLIMFINLVFPTLLIIAGREKLYFWVTFAGAFTNFALNLILIPRYGFFGAAYTTILSEFVVFVLASGLYYRLIKP